MSGLINGITKVFKKIIASPIFKVVLIAVAIYFTGGLALGAGAGAGFAAGEGMAIGATGAMDAGIGMGGMMGTVGVEAASTAATLATVSESAGYSEFATGMTEAGTGVGESAGYSEFASGAANIGETGAGVVDSALPNAGANLADLGEATSSSAVPFDSVTDATLGQDVAANAASNTMQVSGVPQEAAAPSVGSTEGSAGFEGASSSATPEASAPLTPGGPDAQMTSVAQANLAGQGGQALQAQQYGSNIVNGVKNAAGDVVDWYSGLSKPVQLIVGQGISGAAKGIGGYMSTQAQLEAAQKASDQRRADVFTHGEMPTATQMPEGYRNRYKTPAGIVNSGTGS